MRCQIGFSSHIDRIQRKTFVVFAKFQRNSWMENLNGF
jgi:hypothetical protein